MSRRALRLFSILILTLVLAAPLHAAPLDFRLASDSFWARAVAWVQSLWGEPIGRTPPQGNAITKDDQGGMIDPNGRH